MITAIIICASMIIMATGLLWLFSNRVDDFRKNLKVGDGAIIFIDEDRYICKVKYISGDCITVTIGDHNEEDEYIRLRNEIYPI